MRAIIHDLLGLVPPRAASLLTAGLLFALAGGAAAQTGAAAATNGLVLARDLPGAGGHSTSATLQVESTVGHGLAGPPASSALVRWEGGVVYTGSSISVTGPLVLGVQGGFGDRLGGEVETIVGYNFNPGVGLTSVDFAGVPGTGTTVVTNTAITSVSPLGKDTMDNPLGPSSITVTNQQGSSQVADGYVYTPALLKNAEAVLGKPYRMHFLGKPNDFVALIMGLNQPGISIPINGWDGEFNLVFIVFFNTNFQFAPNGSRNFTFTLPVDPAFAGFPFEFQGVTIDNLDPVGGSFTNNLLSFGVE